MAKRNAEEEIVVETVGACLREIRQDYGISQKEAATAAGITRPMLSAYERGKVMVTLPALLRLLDGMNASLSTLHRYLRRREALITGVEGFPMAPEDALTELSQSFSRWLRSVAVSRAPADTRGFQELIRGGFRRLEDELKHSLTGLTESSVPAQPPGMVEGNGEK